MIRIKEQKINDSSEKIQDLSKSKVFTDFANRLMGIADEIFGKGNSEIKINGVGNDIKDIHIIKKNQ